MDGTQEHFFYEQKQNEILNGKGHKKRSSAELQPLLTLNLILWKTQYKNIYFIRNSKIFPKIRTITFLFFSECGYINRIFLMPFKTRYVLLNLCYKTHVNVHKTCIIPESLYLCNVFFIVLDLRLTKVGVQRNSFFYAFIWAKEKQPLVYR